ncbi:hypothetical protein PDK11_29260 [Bacillus cereus]|nr:hypothetical protein [Bacillus cereus]
MKFDKLKIAEKVKSINGKSWAKIGACAFIFFTLNSCHNNRYDRAIAREQSDYNELVDKHNELVKLHKEVKEENTKMKSEIYAKENPPEERPLEKAEEEETQSNPVEEESNQDREEALKVKQQTERKKKAYQGTTGWSEEALKTYKQLTDDKLNRWASEDMLKHAKVGVKFAEIDDAHMPWTDSTVPMSGGAMKKIYLNGHDQLEVTISATGTITKAEYLKNVNE